MTERPAYSHKPITTPILFNKEIARIFQRKCFNCHSDNNLAMSLTTYELARPWARAIREELLERRMPPWGAVTGYGHFANDVSLTQREMDIILSWADGGAPSGVLKVDENIPPVFVPPVPLWDAGEPDEVLTPKTAITIEAGSGDQVRRFEVASTAAASRAVRSIAFRPGARRIVRYAAISDAATGRWLWTWTPWQSSLSLPEGIVARLPARARLAVEIGYRAGEDTISDKSEVGLYFRDAAGAQETSDLVIASAPVSLPSRGDPQRVRAELLVRTPRQAIALWPDAIDGLRSIEVVAVSPEGVSEPLVWVKDVRAEWPTPYVLREPISLARGTRLVMTAYLSNSTDKPVTVTPRVSIAVAPDITTTVR
jgi:hypothetical protein